jgi:hypothetical protein
MTFAAKGIDVTFLFPPANGADALASFEAAQLLF